MYIELRAAYDTIRDKLLKILKEFKIPPTLIKFVRLTLKNVRFRVKIENNLSEQSETSVGLRQEDAVSCMPFNLALGKVIRDSQIETKGTVLIKVSRYLLTQMISIDALKETIMKLMKVARVVRLAINLRKTYYMELTKKIN